MITTEQQNRLKALKESYERLQSLTTDFDPLTQIVEEAIQAKNAYKLQREADRAEAIAEAMVHFDYLESKINDLFGKYGVKVRKYIDRLVVNIYDYTYTICAHYSHGHAPFSSIEFGIDYPRSAVVHKEDIDYNTILTQVAKFIAKNIKPTA